MKLSLAGLEIKVWESLLIILIAFVLLLGGYCVYIISSQPIYTPVGIVEIRTELDKVQKMVYGGINK